MTNQASRRAFLKRASALGMAGVAAPWAINLLSIAEAAAATATDYKALVCVFLNGGNDYANTLIPYDTANYALYQQFRPALAYARDALTATALAPAAPVIDSAGASRQYALAPELAPLLPIFNAGHMGVMMNVGPLVQPTTKAQYTAKSVPLPPKLFSHNDQQSIWQSSAPEGAVSGWGGGWVTCSKRAMAMPRSPALMCRGMLSSWSANRRCNTRCRPTGRYSFPV